ncbi:MAG TPA: hypothetical protein VJY65_10380, partial [Chloroflexota bacterium]|nr:hypothetical protein [Chloroflexota bacterium]
MMVTKRASRHVRRLLTINSGSSSLKAALYHLDQAERLDLAAQIDRIGLPDSRVHIADTRGVTVLEQQGAPQRGPRDHHTALQTLLTGLHHNGADQDLDAVGHRVVHGGSHYSQPQLITAELIATLKQLVPLAPDHLPQAIDAIEAVGHAYPALPQVACFDTAFHRHMPTAAQMYALPRQLWDTGVVRYGFHGLSYESIMHELRAVDGAAADGRVIIAH